MQPSWTDPDKWDGLVDGRTCPFCIDGAHGVIARLGTVRVTMDPNVNVRGYCCLVLEEHATELHAMPAPAATRFMADVQHAARVIQRVTGAIKLNYEVHGNVVPHVHMHIIPRYPDDAIQTTGARFAQLTESPYRAGEFAALSDAIAEALVK